MHVVVGVAGAKVANVEGLAEGPGVEAVGSMKRGGGGG